MGHSPWGRKESDMTEQLSMQCTQVKNKQTKPCLDRLLKMPFSILSWASLVAQMVKNLSAMQDTWVQSLGQEDPLEKGMATHRSILAWRIP